MSYTLLFVFLSVLLVDVHKALEWDYLVFSLEWPATYCSSHTCKLPYNIRNFNIHGLWPTVWPSGSPENCSKNKPFDVKIIEPIYKDLQDEWVNLEDYDNPKDFWSHEWGKHGVCATTDPLISNELDYFNISLAIKSKVNLLRRLESVGIKPNDRVTLKTDGLLAQLKKLFNVNVLVYCSLKHHQMAKLSEVRVCMNPSLNFISCPTSQDTGVNNAEHEKHSSTVCSTNIFGIDMCKSYTPWLNLLRSCSSQESCTSPMLSSNAPCPEELIFPDFI
ncbi:unnamed protein product [Heterobilharzia americana]|nr:unnamed protein product [Heterobilharzia americana]CAH8431375.1 unnamed protein product [Heterobilharzia americana]